MRKKHLLYLIGVIALGLLLTALSRGPAVNFPFIWDDSYVLQPSSRLSGCDVGSFLRVFDPEYWLREGGPSLRPYRPIRDVVFLLAHRLSGGGPPAYHFFSILFHCLNGLMLLWFAWLFLGNIYAAGVASLIFTAHPVNSEAVAWAKNVAEPLALFFGLLAACLFLHWLRAPHLRRFRRRLLLGACTVAFLLALLSKESAVSVPAILFLWCLMLPKKEDRRRGMLALLPMLLFVAAYGVLEFRAVTLGETENKAFAAKSSLLPLAARIELGGRTMAVYCRAIFLPAKSSPWRKLEIPNPPDPWVVAAGVVVALFLLAHLAYMLVRRRRLHIGFWWVLMGLAPSSNLLAYNLRRPLADQRAYLPSVGYALLIGGICAEIFRRRKSPLLRTGVLALAALMVAALSVFSFQATPVWRHKLALWRHAARQSPTLSKALYNLGVVYGHTVSDLAAIEMYRHALAHKGGPAVETYLNLGTSFSMLAKPEWVPEGTRKVLLRKALECYHHAVRMEEENHWGQNALGGVYADLGNYEKAEKHTIKALEHRPRWAQAAINMGAYSQRQHKYDAALRWYRKAILFDQRSAQAYANTARVLRDQGKLKQGLSWFNRALQFASREESINIRREMGSFCLENQRYHQAIAQFGEALELGDSGCDTYVMLGDACFGHGDFGNAAVAHGQALDHPPATGQAQERLFRDVQERLVRDYLKVNEMYVRKKQPRKAAHARGKAMAHAEGLLRAAPRFARAHTAMAMALQAVGRESDARRRYNAALQLNPNEPEALKRLGRIYAAAPASRDQGIRMLRKACALLPNDAEARLALAKALDAQRRSP